MKGNSVVISVKDIYNLVMESDEHHELRGKVCADRKMMMFLESLGVKEEEYETVLNTLEEETEYQGFVHGFRAAMDLIRVNK